MVHAAEPGAGGGPPSGEAVLRWSSRAHTIAGIEAEVVRLWAATSLRAAAGDAGTEQHVAARTSVMNLVVIAPRPEVGTHVSAVVRRLTGRLPSRTLVVSSADPDGPSWLDAQVQAHCEVPRAGGSETCAEFIALVAGGESGRHLAAIVAPLLIHDLPVTLWWPGDAPLASPEAMGLLAMSDRLVVDGAAWSGDGLDRLRTLSRIVTNGRFGDVHGHVAVSDFAMLRQSRWREAIASSFDRPELRPFLGGFREIVVRYSAQPVAGAANVIKPLYHAAWLASRLGMTVTEPLRPAGGAPDAELAGAVRAGRRRVEVRLVPVESTMPPGTTLGVRIGAGRRTGTLEVTVTAEAEAVIVRAQLDGRNLPPRRFMAPRRTEVELLAETVEAVGRDPVAMAALLTAARLAERP